MKKTPLYDIHLEQNAKMVEFHDYIMPLQYESIISEHHSVRKSAGIFDISHMGRFDISGKNASPFIQYIITNDFTRLTDNQIFYTPMCNEHGGILDDILVYKRSRDHFFLVVNSVNTRKDLVWLQNHAVHFPDLTIKDVTEDISLIALQGPQAQSVLQNSLGGTLDHIKRFYFCDFEWENTQLTISRTGYTGEDGFEIFVNARQIIKLWKTLMAKNSAQLLKPVGLGARDTLRLEAGLLLYGNDIDETVTPLETIIGWTVKFEKDNFIGKQALGEQKAKGITRKLAGFEMMDRGIPRHGYSVKKEKELIGKVTSGSYSPSTNKNIGLCMIHSQYAKIGEELGIQIRDADYRARVTKIPFYKKK